MSSRHRSEVKRVGQGGITKRIRWQENVIRRKRPDTQRIILKSCSPVMRSFMFLYGFLPALTCSEKAGGAVVNRRKVLTFVEFC